MKTIIIDVRTSREFLEGSYPGAINLPSNEFSPSNFQPFRNHAIGLVCFSGNRAEKVKSMLEDHGFNNVTLMQHQIVHIVEESVPDSSVWTVDRQFRLALGLLLGIFLIGNFIFHSPLSLVVLLVVFSGLIYSAVTDNCYLRMFIALLPWNRNQASENLKPVSIQE
ncbi:MAG: rhodanese-like domain-containing protein [Bacteroidetes bacterium]|nr:MAG: rhodanese-like domain-containing protein [Bacteroidota bacterium]